MKKAQPFKIAHLTSLRLVGGVQRDYSQFINFQPESPIVEHHTLLNSTKRIAPEISELIQQQSSVHWLSTYKGVKIPKKPAILRAFHRRRILAQIMPDIVVLWNRPQALALIDDVLNLKIVYYEHGASWLHPDSTEIQCLMSKLFKHVAGVICNSFAARRMIELRYQPGPQLRLDVCLNAIRPDCLPRANAVKEFPRRRPFRLGCAGRFIGLKGFPLALHTLHHLHQQGVDCELYFAGDGDELDACRSLAKALKVENHVTFLGLVDNMSTFYTHIDCFLCPSIREPFGLVCAEAMAHGCPVIATRIDGLPEVVQHAETGFCLAPELPVAGYPTLGGSLHNMPSYVYDPVTDRLVQPKFVYPAAFADKIKCLITKKSLFESMSARAVKVAATKFNYTKHGQDVLNSLIQMSTR